MKKYALFAMAVIAAASLTGCGGKSSDTPTPAPTAVDDINRVFDNADKGVDMDKVDGIKAKTAEDSNDSGKIGDVEVEIEDAKVITYDGTDVLIVSFEFENKTGRDAAFDGQVKATATQNDGELPPSVVTGVEGVACETLAQIVKNGDEIKVQKAFRLDDTDSPVTVTAIDAQDTESTASVTKTFNLK